MPATLHCTDSDTWCLKCEVHLNEASNLHRMDMKTQTVTSPLISTLTVTEHDHMTHDL